MSDLILGKQTEGSSPASIKQMALQALKLSNCSRNIKVADIGAGNGELTRLLLPMVEEITMVDDFVASLQDPKIKNAKTDLNNTWDIQSETFDFVFALEVIEHLENPRHFMREVTRIIKPGGFGFISTPNNNNIFSKLYYLFTGEHRFFQNNCYPAHITAILQKDFLRILKENNLTHIRFFYNYQDTIPKLAIPLNIKSKFLSNSFGVLFKKNNESSNL
jgi:2-polyprenyl-3-methyl-5-hydroxy-6-metoxy-1,4-benzoquinol methylase